MALLKDQPYQQAGDRLGELQKLGQSVWLDYIRRDLIDSGELQRMVAEDHLSGITSNPSIFEKAIAGSSDYDGFLASAAKCKGHDSMTLYEGLAIKDIKDAADVLRPIYERTGRVDGYVSLEVSPYLAHDTKGTVAERTALGQGGARKHIDQGSRYTGRTSSDSATHCRGYQRQYYAIVFAKGVRASRRGIHRGPGRTCAGKATWAGWAAWQVSLSAALIH